VKLGLFDDPFRRIDARREQTRTRTDAHLALARDAARQSIVMLKNEGDLLPLPRSGKRIALIGPFAEGKLDLLGPWSIFGRAADCIDLATGVRAAVEDASQVTVKQGCLIEKPLRGGIDAAVAAARAADIVVLAIGEGQSMSGEAESRTEITLPAPQRALAEAIAAVGKPMVVLLKNGRPLALEGAVLDAPAILVTWFLGSETGSAIADVLFGAHGPSGRLPVSFPLASGQQPYYYAHKPTGRPNRTDEIEAYKARYRDTLHRAQFAFGHGLTYGRIEYSNLNLSSETLDWNGTLTVRATVSNRGSRAAVEVAQLYIRDIAASVTRPVRELKAYQRVALAPGESKEITFTLSRRDLTFVGRNLQPTAEAGEFDVWVAPSAEAAGLSDRFVLTASAEKKSST
jgi:beta-glucosidase